MHVFNNRLTALRWCASPISEIYNKEEEDCNLIFASSVFVNLWDYSSKVNITLAFSRSGKLSPFYVLDIIYVLYQS